MIEEHWVAFGCGIGFFNVDSSILKKSNFTVNMMQYSYLPFRPSTT